MIKSAGALAAWLSVTLVVGIAIGGGLGHVLTPPAEPPRGNPSERGLDATLWMQTAAEYDACCLQAYRLGSERLKVKLSATAPPNSLPPAVVLDLDETVLDNSPFQAYLILHKLTFSDDLWARWEGDHADDVRLIAGAKEFIDTATEKKVVVIYISNRDKKYTAQTIAALKHLGLDTEKIEERLLLRDGPKASSNKTARRQEVEKKYRVLLYFGDNLRDFSEEFVVPKDPTVADIVKRQEQVRHEQKHFGDDWIILPNPVYGEWTKLLGKNPQSRLRSVNLEP
jgi:acid phosphatase